jgi:hypothetical protein
MSFFEDGICRAYESEPSRAMNIECLMLLDGPLDSSAFRGMPAIPCWHMFGCCGTRTDWARGRARRARARGPSSRAQTRAQSSPPYRKHARVLVRVRVCGKEVNLSMFVRA